MRTKLRPLDVDGIADERVYEHTAASLGHAVLQRCPIALIPDADRGEVLRMYAPISWHMPGHLTLTEVARELGGTPS